MVYRFIFFGLLISLVYGCGSPYQLYNVIPITNGTSPHANRALSVEDEDVRTVLNFDSQAGNYFSFFAIIKNKSDSTIIFYPEDIYAEVFTNENTDSAKPAYLDAFNPEIQLASLDKDLVQLEEKHSVNTVLNCFLVGIFTIDAVTDIGKDKSEEEIMDDEDNWNYLMDKMEQDNMDYEDEKYQIEQEKEFWQSELLQVASLAHEEKTAGLFYLPIKASAKWFRVVIPVGEKEYIYNFKQVKQE